jgi:hypothetical protein
MMIKRVNERLLEMLLVLVKFNGASSYYYYLVNEPFSQLSTNKKYICRCRLVVIVLCWILCLCTFLCGMWMQLCLILMSSNVSSYLLSYAMLMNTLILLE